MESGDWRSSLVQEKLQICNASNNIHAALVESCRTLIMNNCIPSPLFLAIDLVVKRVVT
jgi:hypothetical protein